MPSQKATKMGKASKWFIAVLGLKKPDPVPSSQHHQQTPTRSKEKKRWSFVKSYREKDDHIPLTNVGSDHQEPTYQVEDPYRKNVAVAASAKAVEVAKLTGGSSGGRVAHNKNSSSMAYINSSHSWREDLAAIKIQSAFRGYLARRALRALKSLVRLQALVRGHIQRKRTAEWLHHMQALLKAQARARAMRIQISSESSLSSTKSSHFHHPGPPTPEKFEHAIRARSGRYGHSSVLKRTGSKSDVMAIGHEDKADLAFNWSERRMEERSCVQRVNSARSGTMYDDRGDGILEMDTGEPVFIAKRRNLFHSFHTLASDQYSYSFTNSKDSTTRQTVPSSSFSEVQSLTPLNFPQEDDEAFRTAENSPQFYSASSRGGGISPFAPGKSHVSTSFLSGCSDYYPNYMSYTESSRAKVRSISAPKQRPQYDRSTPTKRHSIHGFGEPRLSSTQRASSLRANFTSKAYPGSGRLDRLGLPVGQSY